MQLRKAGCGSASAAEQMLQAVGNNFFICGLLVYLAGQQEPVQIVCARQQFPLCVLSL